MRRIIPLIVILVGWTFGLGTSLDVPANDRHVDIGNEDVLRTSIGVTPGGIVISAIVHTEDFDYSTKKTRVLLVGWSDSESRAIGSALRWFYKSDEASSLREQYILSAVPNAFPEAERRPARQFPASGKAYADPKTMEPLYLWRWIGMHAPDLVVDVQVGRSAGWFIPPGSKLAKSGLASRLGSRAEGRTNELATALVRHRPCDTGTIEALRVTVVEAKPAFLPNLLSALCDSKIHGPSAARVEIQRRLDRSPIQVARQLGKHYGHELNRVVYIPALALMGRLRLGDLTNDPTHFEDVRRIVGPYFDGGKPTKPSSGSGLSGHLIFTELASRSKGTERTRLLNLARNSADLAFDMQGKLNASMPFHNEMSDALFMGGPILAHVGKLTGDEKYFDACTRHLRFMRKLVLREDDLYRHSPLEEAAWGRGNGFPALGLALCLSHWPEDRNRSSRTAGDVSRAHGCLGGSPRPQRMLASSRRPSGELSRTVEYLHDHFCDGSGNSQRLA